MRTIVYWVGHGASQPRLAFVEFTYVPRFGILFGGFRFRTFCIDFRPRARRDGQGVFLYRNAKRKGLMHFRSNRLQLYSPVPTGTGAIFRSRNHEQGTEQPPLRDTALALGTLTGTGLSLSAVRCVGWCGSGSVGVQHRTACSHQRESRDTQGRVWCRVAPTSARTTYTAAAVV